MSGCPHGMPSPASCTDCMADGPVAPPPRWKAIDGPFRARFPGVCTGCDSEFAVSDLVQRYDRGERTVYVHQGHRP